MDATTLLPLGIHFGLDAERHHDDPGLGYTRIRMLRRNPTAFWHKNINPNRKPEKSTRGKTRGDALHTLLFDGEESFDQNYMRGAEHDADMTAAEKGALTKEANKRAAALGKIALLSDDYDRVIISRALIEKDPELQTAFANGFPEVSIFWERDGVRRKARIDYLKVRGVGDLKGIQNKDDMDFEECCRLAINRFRYDLQCSHYMEARRLVPSMVADGMIYGDHDPELLKKVAASKVFAWQWVFYCMEGAPDICSPVISPGNPIVDAGDRDVEIAISRYVRLMKQFGETQWVISRAPRELTFEMMPVWFARTSPDETAEYEAWMRSKGG